MAVGQFKVVAKAAPTPGQSVGQVSFFDENGDPIDIGGSGGGATAWADITGKPAVIAAGADQAAARTAIGAGTSSLALGATATTAAAGNHVHAASAVTVAAATGIVGANVQAVLADLAARVVALEAG